MTAARILLASLTVLVLVSPFPLHAELLTGTIVDADTGKPVAARLYIRSESGDWYFARSASDQGSAVEYRKQRKPNSNEMHTSLTAHPFVADVPAGRYHLTAERGKEYVPKTAQIDVGPDGAEIRVELKRWINLSDRGWYSGDTHVHRAVDELPTAMLADDVNVTFPLTYWVTRSHTAPTQGSKSTKTSVDPNPIHVDRTHVIYPLNTEYEIFSVGGKRHTLGAVFVLNHKRPLELVTPPAAPIAEEARRQGAILDLDKHSWPWSLMIVPKMKVDLFELSNNHIWRTEFLFRDWTIDMVGDEMGIERDADGGMTEWGWLDFGFQTYYALLNCGFRMQPTGGTASGVHPVGLGFGRVYVNLPDGFSYDTWVAGLKSGRSFVTTGPMLFVRFARQTPGHVFKVAYETTACPITGVAESLYPLDRIEIIVNGEVAQEIAPENLPRTEGGYRSTIQTSVPIDETSWVAVRCFETRPEDRLRFAHTAPVHFEIPDKPLRSRRAEVRYLVKRMQEEIERNRGVLSADELREYVESLDFYRGREASAR